MSFKYNYIDVVFNSSGNVVYTRLPEFINQYSTNYMVRAGFTSIDIQPELVTASIFNSQYLPARHMFASTNERIDANGTIIKLPYIYELTIYDTQTFQSELQITINVENYDGTFFNHTLNIPMKKGAFNKVVPNGLETDSSINSIAKEVNRMKETINKYVDANGDVWIADENPTPLTVVARDSNGAISAADPIRANQVSTKGYTDSEITSTKAYVDSTNTELERVTTEKFTEVSKNITNTDEKLATEISERQTEIQRVDTAVLDERLRAIGVETEIRTLTVENKTSIEQTNENITLTAESLTSDITTVQNSVDEERNRATTKETQLESSINVNADAITLRATKTELSDAVSSIESKIKIQADRIDILVEDPSVPTGASIIAAINEDETSGVTISADKVNLIGAVTANNNFKILEDGSIEANNGTFTGTVNATSGGLELGAKNSEDYLKADATTLEFGGYDWKKTKILAGELELEYDPLWYAVDDRTDLCSGKIGYNTWGGDSIDGRFGLDFTMGQSTTLFDLSVVNNDYDEYDYNTEHRGSGIYINTGASLNINGAPPYSARLWNMKSGGTWYCSSADFSNSSDRNLKNSIEDLPDAYSSVFDKLRPVRFKFNNGTSGRYHTGFIAQEVLDAVETSGLSSQDFAAYIEDTVGNEKTCSIRYTEIIALLVKEVQTLKTKVSELENKINGN